MLTKLLFALLVVSSLPSYASSDIEWKASASTKAAQSHLDGFETIEQVVNRRLVPLFNKLTSGFWSVCFTKGAVEQREKNLTRVLNGVIKEKYGHLKESPVIVDVRCQTRYDWKRFWGNLTMVAVATASTCYTLNAPYDGANLPQALRLALLGASVSAYCGLQALKIAFWDSFWMNDHLTIYSPIERGEYTWKSSSPNSSAKFSYWGESQQR